MVTTSTSHGLAVGDTVYLSSIMSEINSTATSSSTTAITIAALGTTPATTFFVPGTTPAAVTSTYSGSAGRVQECFTSTCQFQVQTSGSHTFAAGDRVFIQNVTWNPTASAPVINTTAGSSLSISTSTANAFLFPSLIGPYYTNTYNASSGQAITCFGTAATCEMQLTAASHGLVAGDRAFITGVVGLTGSTTVNNLYTGQSGGPTSWAPTSITTDTFILPGTTGPSMTAYTASSGSVFCLKSGCKYYRYTASDSSTPIRPISNCDTERTGTESYTGAGPAAGQWLGADYPIASSTYNDCLAANTIVPLTSTKSTLHNTINNLQVTGSTAGQIGVGWGWYMLAPSFGSVWPAAESTPLAYNTNHLSKVMVLMTDGDFNTGHCGGVAAKDYQVGLANSEKANCNATNGSPYTQASTLCTNMKASTVKIEIYTVGFQVTAGSAADQFLAACATQTGGTHYFLASNNSELEAAFAQIATNISRLRISR
jgi:putative hemolysin